MRELPPTLSHQLDEILNKRETLNSATLYHILPLQARANGHGHGTRTQRTHAHRRSQAAAAEVAQPCALRSSRKLIRPKLQPTPSSTFSERAGAPYGPTPLWRCDEQRVRGRWPEQRCPVSVTAANGSFKLWPELLSPRFWRRKNLKLF